ncbi:cupredoxin domain-containing protein [Pueribacillus theae]|uniref:cytochrome C oxidase subunit II n=1 Tax=Pueribacillus theae TaxID=2171751 RepID=UPI001F0C6FC4|nr:cytochrome C oxidase subunit II [Pueribacillus theae]
MIKNLQMSLCLAFIFLLVACTDKEKFESIDDPSVNKSHASPPGETVTLEASYWTFDQETYKVPAGDVTIHLKNKEGFHGIIIEGTDVSIEGDGSYHTTLEPGEYKIFCSIICGTGHSDMTATLIVE